MVELKLFHKVLLAIAVIILLIKLTERFSPKPMVKTLTSYIPKRSRPSTPVMPVSAPRYESDVYIPPVRSAPRPSPSFRRDAYPVRSMPVSAPAPSPESSGEIFYIKGI